MDPKFTITRKTYYALGLLAAACSTAGALCALAGQPLAVLDSAAFALAGMTLLLLAAVKGSPKQQKGRYFACFVLLILSAVVTGPAGRILAASYWPAFLWVEALRSPAARPAARLLTACEVLSCMFFLAASVGGLQSLVLFSNLFWLLTAVTRGWAALTLYKAESRAMQGQSPEGAKQ